MLQALLGQRAKAQEKATQHESETNNKATEGVTAEDGDLIDVDGAPTSIEAHDPVCPPKRKRDTKEEKKSDNLLQGEKIHVTNVGVLLRSGVKSQEGQEDTESETDSINLLEGACPPLPYHETAFGTLPPEMVLQIFGFFLDDLPFLVSNIGLTCRFWNEMSSTNPLWKRIIDLDEFRSVLSWISPASSSGSAAQQLPVDDAGISYKNLFCKYHARIQNNWKKGSYTIKTLTGHKDFIRCVRFDRNHRAVSSGVDRTVCVWDLKTGDCLQAMKGHTGEVDSVDFFEDTIVSGSFDSTIRFWDAKTGECTKVLKEAGSILMWCVHLFPESNRVLCPGSLASLALWDSDNSKVLHRYTNPTSANVMSMYACGQSGPTEPLLTGSSDKIIRLWDAETGLCKLEMTGHTDSIWAVHYTQGAVITASSDRTVKMWDLRSGDCVETLRGHTGTVFCMWADGNYVVSGDSNDWLIIWDLRQRRPWSYKEHEGGLRSVQNDSYKIVSASWDKTIKVWSFV